MKASANKSLKSQSYKWLVGLVLADAVVVPTLVAPEILVHATLTTVGLYRLLGTVVIPIIVLLLINVPSAAVKATLVYWKPLGWLPGSEAFTKIGPTDPRVDMAALKKNVGAWGEAPSEQNVLWFKLYKRVEDSAEVAGAHKEFLMYRDMAVISLMLAIVAPVMLTMVVHAPGISAAKVALLLVVQYGLTAVSANNAGKRFVSSVLALHSTKRITMPSSAAR